MGNHRPHRAGDSRAAWTYWTTWSPCRVTCNSRKGGTRGQIDERRRVPGWDGLGGLFPGLVPQYESRLSAEDLKWLQALQRQGIQPQPDHATTAISWLRRFKTGEPFDELDALAPSLVAQATKGEL